MQSLQKSRTNITVEVALKQCHGNKSVCYPVPTHFFKANPIISMLHLCGLLGFLALRVLGRPWILQVEEGFGRTG